MANRPVVFIDFDGALFPSRILMLPENNEGADIVLSDLGLPPLVSYWKMDPVAVAMLNDLHAFRRFSIVVTGALGESSIIERRQIESLLKINGIRAKLHNSWNLPIDVIGDNEKFAKVKMWMKGHECQNYAVINAVSDESDVADKIHDGIDCSKVEHVNSDDGISLKNYYKIKAIIALWD